MLVGDRHRRIASERRPAGEHLVKHAAGRIQVGAHVDVLAARLLGRQVLRGAHDTLRLGHCGGGIIERAGDAEVHDLHNALLGDHDVAGLDIAVDDAHAVRIFERVEHADHHMLGVGDAQRAVRLDDVAQRLPPAHTHDQVRQVFGLPVVECDHLFARIVDVHDVRVVHLGHGMSLTAEAGEEDLVMCEVGAHDLDGNGAAGRVSSAMCTSAMPPRPTSWPSW